MSKASLLFEICWRTLLLLAFAGSAVLPLAACETSGQSAPPSDEQILRDARNRVEAQARGAVSVRDFAVESVKIDEFEKDKAQAVVSYKAGGLTGRVGVTYRRADGFWRLERAVDLGLK